MSQDRPEAVQNAVRFLSDAKVQEAPLAKKIAFLEGKGLTASEIQSALNQVGGAVPAAMPPVPVVVPQPTPAVSPWKTAAYTSLGLLGAGSILLWAAKTYLGPYFDLPSGESVRNDTEALQKHMEGSGKALDQVTLSTQDIIKGMESHAKEVSASLAEMSDLLMSLKENDEKKAQDLKKIQQEVDELKTTFPKLVEKTQENQANMLDQIQAEMKSLKSLLLNRKVGAGANGTTSVLGAVLGTSGQSADSPSFTPSFAGVNFSSKPSIPSWQLSAAASLKSANATPAGPPAPADKTQSAKPAWQETAGRHPSIDGIHEEASAPTSSDGEDPYVDASPDSDGSTDTAILIGKGKQVA
ncbi:peroxisomal membrane protein pex14 [Kappamyces sp. JEL0829]|nr:peroxisomal membrane protein pex14 [Kappamyces sp. JEL0829]